MKITISHKKYSISACIAATLAVSVFLSLSPAQAHLAENAIVQIRAAEKITPIGIVRQKTQELNGWLSPLLDEIQKLLDEISAKDMPAEKLRFLENTPQALKKIEDLGLEISRELDEFCENWEFDAAKDKRVSFFLECLRGTFKHHIKTGVQGVINRAGICVLGSRITRQDIERISGGLTSVRNCVETLASLEEIHLGNFGYGRTVIYVPGMSTVSDIQHYPLVIDSSFEVSHEVRAQEIPEPAPPDTDQSRHL